MKAFIFFLCTGGMAGSGFGKGDSIAMQITKCEVGCNIVLNLNFETHHLINNNSPAYSVPFGWII